MVCVCVCVNIFNFPSFALPLSPPHLRPPLSTPPSPSLSSPPAPSPAYSIFSLLSSPPGPSSVYSTLPLSLLPTWTSPYPVGPSPPSSPHLPFPCQ